MILINGLLKKGKEIIKVFNRKIVLIKNNPKKDKLLYIGNRISR